MIRYDDTDLIMGLGSLTQLFRNVLYQVIEMLFANFYCVAGHMASGQIPRFYTM